MNESTCQKLHCFIRPLACYIPFLIVVNVPSQWKKILPRHIHIEDGFKLEWSRKQWRRNESNLMIAISTLLYFFQLLCHFLVLFSCSLLKFLFFFLRKKCEFRTSVVEWCVNCKSENKMIRWREISLFTEKISFVTNLNGANSFEFFTFVHIYVKNFKILCSKVKF